MNYDVFHQEAGKTDTIELTGSINFWFVELSTCVIKKEYHKNFLDVKKKSGILLSMNNGLKLLEN